MKEGSTVGHQNFSIQNCPLVPSDYQDLAPKRQDCKKSAIGPFRNNLWPISVQKYDNAKSTEPQHRVGIT